MPLFKIKGIEIHIKSSGEIPGNGEKFGSWLKDQGRQIR